MGWDREEVVWDRTCWIGKECEGAEERCGGYDQESFARLGSDLLPDQMEDRTLWEDVATRPLPAPVESAIHDAAQLEVSVLSSIGKSEGAMREHTWNIDLINMTEVADEIRPEPFVESLPRSLRVRLSHDESPSASMVADTGGYMRRCGMLSVEAISTSRLKVQVEQPVCCRCLRYFIRHGQPKRGY